VTLITIKTYTLAPMAHMDVGILKNEGVPSFVADEYISGAELTNPGIGYIKLQVPEDLAARATAILSEAHASSA
jgi:hypothetical protein